jgi:hypothetical protein
LIPESCHGASDIRPEEFCDDYFFWKKKTGFSPISHSDHITGSISQDRLTISI